VIREQISILTKKGTNQQKIFLRVTRYSKYIYFNISIIEENFDEAVLSYDYLGRTKEKRLCSRLRDGGCEKRFTMREGYTNLKLIIRDDAGNEFEKELDLS